MHGWLIGTLLLLQITCSTLSQLLDSVLEQEGFQIGSVCGKKKGKAIKLHKSYLHNDVIRKDENALSFLSSILDTCSLIIICFFFLIFRCSNWQNPQAAAMLPLPPGDPILQQQSHQPTTTVDTLIWSAFAFSFPSQGLFFCLNHIKDDIYSLRHGLINIWVGWGRISPENFGDQTIS